MHRREFQISLLGLLGTAMAGPLVAQVSPGRKTQPGNPELRAVTRKILDRIAKDAAFRKKLLADPNQALIDAGFERELQAIAATAATTECSKTCGYRSCTRTCIGTCRLSCKVVAAL